MQYALQPFGLEHLMKVPLNQSGLSKDYDMQEGFAFLQGMRDHVGSLLYMTVNSIVMMIGKGNKKDRDLSMPSIVMPTKFNLSTADSISLKLKDSYTYGLPDHIKLKYSEMLVDKESGVNSYDSLYFKLRVSTDPMPASSQIEKQNSRMFLSDYKFILTNNIDAILKEAINENEGFLRFEYSTQQEIIKEITNRYLLDAEENLKKNGQAQSYQRRSYNRSPNYGTGGVNG
jgi:hypothetical protein